MQTEEITIHVDPGAAQAYRTAPDEVRRKLDLLLNIRLQDACCVLEAHCKILMGERSAGMPRNVD